MKVIGLTGSIAMGKSEVANVIRSLAIPVFDADAAVHQLYNSKEGTHLLRSLTPEAVTEDVVDRRTLSRLIAENPELLQRIERLVHPHVARMRNSFLNNAERSGIDIVVLDIPLLFENATDTNLDAVIVVSAQAAIQRKRALARPGMTPEKLDIILTRQMPDAEKRRRADYIIENDGSLDELRQKTTEVINQIRDT